MTTASPETSTSAGGSLMRLVGLLTEKPGMTCAELGNALWGKRAQGDIVPARFARPAGALCMRALKTGLVYHSWNEDRQKHVWYARKQHNDQALRPHKL